MDAQAGMLARLFERSMGLGDEWEVSDVWFEEREGAQDELHVRVAHREGPGGGMPRMPQEVRHLRHAREDLEASRHLAVRDDRPLRRAEGRLPRGRRPCLQDALGGAPELALHGALRGAGDRDGALRHDRDGDSASGARDGHAHMAPAREGGIGGEGCRRLLRCRARRDRRHCKEARPELHQHHGRPRRAARHSRHRRKGQGRRGQALRRARGARRGPHEGPGGHPRHGRGIFAGGRCRDAPGRPDRGQVPCGCSS
jgi:hypothetical protein